MAQQESNQIGILIGKLRQITKTLLANQAAGRNGLQEKAGREFYNRIENRKLEMVFHRYFSSAF